MNLVIDAGNTSTKLAVFRKQDLLFHSSTDADGFHKTVKDIFSKFPDISHALVASVGLLGKRELNVLSIFCKVELLTSVSKVPFKNSYASPATLGVDRIALATAAFYNYPHTNVLVIDAGTCITYDMVNDYGEYLGGAISPGLRMRYQSLNEHTARLPLLDPSPFVELIGNTTEKSIHSGVIYGICKEIDGVISEYQSRFEHLTVILTGGDGQFLSNRLKNTIFANSNFLLEGLNYLLDYNKH
ncbi:type III pantothenate kinase [Muriicola marianensis]|uniref:Type III pantothenate kinase n=1 Tax=Muriicola marianensis TaxID=1324801 RepID=A0ABQ1R3J4_9FLAO|nr:type III pantothenate kinase [Muriicola marianensis]GGD53686.1 type III pantothenate kinase [Muriicola marianensis]